ncbi:MAG: site-2 protease family protein [Kiritimatiellaceae bacterium]|nr:site-2 protease family protein [Kiritimatiellaceae bacterium]
MKMVNNALSIGSVFGIPIRLHISLLIAIGLFSLLSGAGIIVTLILGVGLFGSVALHELGHSVVAKAKGGYIHEIVLYPFGGAAKISNIPSRPKDEILVALAGPAVSLVLAVLCYQVAWLEFVGYANSMLFFFNILPVFPMDGGRVLRAMMTLKKGRLIATRDAASIGKFFCGLFILIGLFGFPYQLFGVIGPCDSNLILMFIGFYIYRAGQMEYRMVRMEHQANHCREGWKEDVGVEVSPPPYADARYERGSIAEKLRNLFRR